MKADVLMGMQYGSEGKGFIARALAPVYDASVRSGGPNAGHCILHNGKEYKMRQVPCGWVNPRTDLFLGPAMVINPDVLRAEIEMLEDDGFSVRDRLYIHENAALISEEHMRSEATLRNEIGSTAEGVGACRRGKIERLRESVELAKESGEVMKLGNIVNRFEWNQMLGSYVRVLLEGTQGAGLCMVHGEYPYCTSSGVTAAQLMSDAGIPMNCLGKIYGVIRTKPIRVAGNSGPLKGETTFESLGQPEEHTTVTKKVRRIADDIDWDELDHNMLINGITDICLTFGDYLSPEDLDGLVIELENRYTVPVSYVGMGANGEYVGRAGIFAAMSRGYDIGFDPNEALDDVFFNQVKPLLLAKREKYGTDNINNLGEAGILTRVYDKVMRLKNVLIDRAFEITDDEDPWLDLTGYGLIALVRRRFGRW